MAVFLGHKGNVRLKRGASVSSESFSSSIGPDDINTTLNILGFDGASENIVTGDRIVIATTDTRGLICFATSAWSANAVQDSLSAYVNVNAAGGLRFFPTFEDAINNNRDAELSVASFSAPSIAVEVQIEGAIPNILGNVEGYTFNTDRDAIDSTTLSDKFRRQYSAGLISGAGTIDCLFDYRTSGVKEAPLLMLQLVQRVDIGSEFGLSLYLTEGDPLPNSSTVYYDLEAMVTRAGVSVEDDGIIACTIDFVTTGDIRLLIGDPLVASGQTPTVGRVLKEDDDGINLEQSLNYLLQ
jgi:hypothetical protein